MGELARFEDIRIKMCPMDTQKHKEPYFHVILTDGGIQMQSPDIKSAKILKNYKILLTFKNGARKIFDMKPYLKYTVFKPLNDENEFKKFSIIDGTIEQECGADLSTDTFFIESYDIDEKALEEM